MKWFAGITTLEALKKAYRELSKMHHPDLGGNEQNMKSINAEYEKLFLILKNNPQTKESKSAHTVNDGFREVINQIVNIPNIIIEICGSWIWISGNTYHAKDALKEAGFHWASKKKMWFWHSPEETTYKHKPMAMENIRLKYGSEKIETKESIRIAG